MIRMSSGLRASEKNLDRGLLPYRAIMDRRLKKADRFGFELPRSALCEKPMISKKSQFYVRRSGVSVEAQSKFNTLSASPVNLMPGTVRCSTGGITLSITGSLVDAPKTLLITTVYAPQSLVWRFASSKQESMVVPLTGFVPLRNHWWENGAEPAHSAVNFVVEPM